MRNSEPVVLAVLLLCSCDRVYTIQGTAVVPRGISGNGVPALVCVGRGGPLESSAIYGHPANHASATSQMEGTLFCRPAADDIEFPFRETIIAGHLPREARVYAWLEPVPLAAKLCDGAASTTLDIDARTLDHLVSPRDADKPPGERAPVTWPCGRNPMPGTHLASAVTFDPDHKTWSDDFVEERTLRIE